LRYSFDFFFKPDKNESGGDGERAVRFESINRRDSQGFGLHQLSVWRSPTDRYRLVVKVQKYRLSKLSRKGTMNCIVLREPIIQQVRAL
jgi:hypothetical protein